MIVLGFLDAADGDNEHLDLSEQFIRRTNAKSRLHLYSWQIIPLQRAFLSQRAVQRSLYPP